MLDVQPPSEGIPIVVLGLIVNVAGVFPLSGGHHDHGHGRHHGHSHAPEHGHDKADEHVSHIAGGRLALAIREDGVRPRFRVRAEEASPAGLTVRTVRPDGTTALLQIPRRADTFEPNEVQALLRVEWDGRAAEEHTAVLEEHEHGDHALHRDNDMRAAIVHVIADAAVSLLVIVGLVLARIFGWLWLDPLVSCAGIH